MRKLTLAAAVLATALGGALATSASAAPGVPMGVAAPETVTNVMMTPMERRMMERRMMRRHMERRMERRMMRHHMERRMERRMMRNM